MAKLLTEKDIKWLEDNIVHKECLDILLIENAIGKNTFENILFTIRELQKERRLLANAISRQAYRKYLYWRGKT